MPEIGLFQESMTEPVRTWQPDPEPGTADVDELWYRPNEALAQISTFEASEIPQRFSVVLPDGSAVTALLESFEDQGTRGFTWTGRVPGDEHGVFALTRVDDQWAGQIAVHGDYWSFGGNTWTGVRIFRAVDTAPAECGAALQTGLTPAPDTGTTAADTAETATPDTDSIQPPDDPLAPDPLTDDVVIDLLVAYNQVAAAKIAARDGSGPNDYACMDADIFLAVSLLNRALRNSDIHVRVQLVDRYFVYAPPPPPGGAWPSFTDMQAWLKTSPAAPYQVIRNRRDTPGVMADLVMYITPGASSSGASEVLVEPGALDAPKAYGTVGWRWSTRPGTWSFAHEVGHLLGGCHDRNRNDASCRHSLPGQDGQLANYAWEPGPGQAQLSTLLQHGGGGRVLYFANPDVSYNGSPTGTTSVYPGPNGDRSSDQALEFEDAAPIIAAFRAGPGGGSYGTATMVSPLETTALAGPIQVFSWAAGQPGWRYRLQVGTTWGAADVYDATTPVSPNPGSTASVPLTPQQASAPLFVSLWTESVPAVWVVQRYRYNTYDRIVSCSVEDPSLVPDPSFANDACGSFCTFDAVLGKLDCRIAVVPLPVPTTVSAGAVVRSPAPYDIIAWARTWQGDACCLLRTNASAVNKVAFQGTGYADNLHFHIDPADAPVNGTYDLDAVSGTQMDAELSAGNGSLDRVYGSNSASALYHELIDGESGNDHIWAGAGNDRIKAGLGLDQVFAGDGNDIIASIRDFSADQLSGDGGANLLCSGDGKDWMYGTTDAANSHVELYQSFNNNPAPPSTARTIPNKAIYDGTWSLPPGVTLDAWCGAAAWAPSWASCPSGQENLPQPTECAVLNVGP